MTKYIKTAVTLFLISAVCTLLCAIVNNATAPVIAANNENDRIAALEAVSSGFAIGEQQEGDGDAVNYAIALTDDTGAVAGYILGLTGKGYGGAMDIIVIDSVAALVPRQEIEGDMGDSHVGLQARLMSQALRKLTPVISKSNCVVIFINQLREKVGVMFGNPETTTGGRALKFYASVRMDVRRTETLKQGGEIVGNHVRVKIVKNKVAPPFKEAEFDIMFGKGISREGDILDLATGINLVSKSGAWYAYNGDKIGQGRENAKSYLTEHPEVMEELESKVRAYYHIDGSADEAEDGAGTEE